MMAAMLLSGGIQMQISPNVWVMINTLQILRTILLLKINLPLQVRQTIEASSFLATLDFGLTDLIMPDPGEDASIMQIMGGDDLLGQFFEDYGIETYRFIDFAIETFFDCIVLFVTSTLVMAGLSYLYLKIKKKDTAVIKQKLKFVFAANGFVRIYLEILLDGILYIFINLRSVKFINVLDAFSYILLLVFALIVISFTIFLVQYARSTDAQKWSTKLQEILTETPMTKDGVLAYHLTFILRRVGIAINVIMLGTLDPNIHITLHCLNQAVVLGMMFGYPMFENRFQKGKFIFHHTFYSEQLNNGSLYHDCICIKLCFPKY